MERVGGETLRQWLAAHPDAGADRAARLAEDLLAGLDYLEQKAVDSQGPEAREPARQRWSAHHHRL